MAMQMIGKTLGRYEIVEKIGSGGWGDVYRARDTRLDRDVALKVLSERALQEDTSRKRFRKEALVLSRLNHPNIATILDFDTQEGLDFIVMEYIIGTTLNDVLSKGQLSEKDIIHYSIQIASALEDAHQVGIIHRDLKPSNVIVTQKGQVKVLDFGLAKMLMPFANQQAAHLSTETNLVVGTFPYMSPEQLRTESIDARSDIYSFGVTFYEMATGQRPHTETQPISLVDAILHKEPLLPGQVRQDLSPRLQDIIMKCLQKDPDSRYQSAKELLLDLRRLLTPSMYSAMEQLTKPSGRRGWRRIRLFAGVPAVLFAITFATFFLLKRISNNPATTTGPKIRSVVALPSNVFGGEENKFFTDAIPNALSTQLSQIQGLETKVPPTSIEMARVEGDLMKLAQAYGVQALVASSVTADKNKLILNVQLIEAGTRRLMWSRDYDGTRDNYLQIVQTAAEGLRTALNPSSSPLAEHAPSSNDAELIFQRGYYHMRAYANTKKQEAFNSALSDLQRALQLDPTNARAAAALARLYVGKLEAGEPLRTTLPEIDKWAYHSLDLDYRCGEAWQALSTAEEFRPNSNQRKRLEYSLKAATYASHSGYSHHVLSSALTKNSFVMAEEASKEATNQEPLYLNGLLFRSAVLARQGRATEALDLIDQVLKLEKNMPMGLLMREWLLLQNHQVQEAEKAFTPLDQLVVEHRLHPGWVEFGRDWLNFERSIANKDSNNSRVALQRLVSQARGEAPPFVRWEIITGNVLPIQASNDLPSATLETLSIRAGKGILEPYDWLILSPQLAEVRKEPQFKSIVAKSRAQFEGMIATLNEARARKELPAYLEKPLADLTKLLAH